MSDYDPAKDAHDSYFAAIEAKRQRGDTSWVPPRLHQVRVTDHAIIRYLQRVLDIDVDMLRAEIAAACERSQGAPSVRIGGARFLVSGDTVVTVLDDETVPRFNTLSRLSRNNRKEPV